MATPGIEFHHVWKRFRRGELHDSLRDLLPAMAKRLVGRAQRADELRTGDFWALKDVSFRVEPGQALGIIGPNGAGKSTVLKILTRILRPNRGGCTVRGRIGALIEVAAGFHPDLTGRENVFLQGAIMGMSAADTLRKFDEIVEFSGIADFIDTPVKRYSSGMNARLGFSIAVHLDPDVLIIDEVLAVGDYSVAELRVRREHGPVRVFSTACFSASSCAAGTCGPYWITRPTCSRLCTRFRCGTSWWYCPQIAHTGSCGPCVGGSESQLAGSGSFGPDAGRPCRCRSPAPCSRRSSRLVEVGRAGAATVADVDHRDEADADRDHGDHGQHDPTDHPRRATAAAGGPLDLARRGFDGPPPCRRRRYSPASRGRPPLRRICHRIQPSRSSRILTPRKRPPRRPASRGTSGSAACRYGRTVS